MNLLTFTESRDNKQLMKVLTSKKVHVSPIFHEDRNFGISSRQGVNDHDDEAVELLTSIREALGSNLDQLLTFLTKDIRVLFTVSRRTTGYNLKIDHDIPPSKSIMSHLPTQFAAA
jgi:hypothetical protein